MGEKGIAAIGGKLEAVDIISHFSESKLGSRTGYSIASDFSIFVDFGPPTLPVHIAVKSLQMALAKQIRIRTLHPDLEIEGQPLSELVGSKRIYDISLHTKLINILTSSQSVADEIETLFSLAGLDGRHMTVLLMRYGYQKHTLKVVGDAIQVTRERVRQIEKQAKDRTVRAMQSHSFPRIRSALLFADNIDLSYTEWTLRLLKSGLLGDWTIEEYCEHEPIEMMLTICRVTDAIDIPSNLELMLELHKEGRSSTPARLLYIKNSLSAEAKRFFRKHLNHSGALSVEWLLERVEIHFSTHELHCIFEALGYIEVGCGWYMPDDFSPDPSDKNQVIHRSIQKMFQHCGPVEIRDVYFAIEHTLSRTDFPVPPIDTLETILTKCGYTHEDNCWFWDGSIDEDLNRGEAIILETLNRYNGVAHHSELVAAIVDSALSAASLHATLKRSPLFDRFRKGLYKLRGFQPDYSAIERARSAAERIPINLEVEYDTYGNINLYATLSLMTLANGVLVSEKLPNLAGEWGFVLRGQHWLIRITENEIRGLLPVLNDIDCEVGDRIQLSFNTWKREVSANHLGDRD